MTPLVRLILRGLALEIRDAAAEATRKANESLDSDGRETKTSTFFQGRSQGLYYAADLLDGAAELTRKP